MKLKAQQVYDATLTLAKIIREERPMPQKGAYRIKRLHAKLLPEYELLDKQRDALITAYDHKEEGADQYSVPADKMPEFSAAWAEIAGQEIEVGVEPVSLECLDLGPTVAGPVTARELAVLGELVTE